MAFRDFKSVELVLREYPLELIQEAILPETRLEVPEAFLDDIRFRAGSPRPGRERAVLYRELHLPVPETGVEKTPTAARLVHRALTGDDRLTGEPDYLVSAAVSGVVDRSSGGRCWRWRRQSGRTSRRDGGMSGRPVGVPGN